MITKETFYELKFRSISFHLISFICGLDQHRICLVSIVWLTGSWLSDTYRLDLSLIIDSFDQMMATSTSKLNLVKNEKHFFLIFDFNQSTSSSGHQGPVL
jgi:hypothetical protein